MLADLGMLVMLDQSREAEAVLTSSGTKTVLKKNGRIEWTVEGMEGIPLAKNRTYFTRLYGALLEANMRFLLIAIQFGYCWFPPCSRTTYHNCSGVLKKCPIWSRFLRYPRQKKRFMASVNTRGQKVWLLISPQYASVLKPRQNNKNNRGQKPLLHWWLHLKSRKYIPIIFMTPPKIKEVYTHNF